VEEEIVASLIQSLGLEARFALLRQRAEQAKVTLPKDVALYIAQNVRSNAHALENALNRLTAYSSVAGTQITLAFTQRVLKSFIDAQKRTVIVDSFKNLPRQRFGMRVSEIGFQEQVAADPQVAFSLLKTGEGRKNSRVRHQLEVNMRESERERLARRDVYERELEVRAKKRRQG
jgi:chromosomal replication initiation ATPase DnaA